MIGAGNSDLDEILQLQREAFARLLRSEALSRGEIQTALGEATEAAARLLGVGRVGVWRLVDGGEAIECLDLFEMESGQHSSGTRLAREAAPAYFEAIAEERCIAAHDARTDPRTREFLAGYLEPLGISSMLDAPVFVRGRLVGVVCHEHAGAPRRWRSSEELVACTLADFVGVALAAGEHVDQARAVSAARAELQADFERRTEELRATQQSLKALFDASPVPLILSHARDQTVLAANVAASRLFEVPMEEVAGIRVVDHYVDPEERARILAEVSSRGRADGCEARFRSRSGRVFWGLLSVTPLMHLGEPAMLVSCLDITEKKAVEETLRAEQQMLYAMIDATPVPMVVTGLDDAIVRFANTRAIEFFDTSLGAFVGKRAPDFYVSPSDRAAFVEALRRDRHVDGFVARLKTAAGRQIWAQLAARVFSLKGEVVFAVGFSDLTEQRMMLEAVLDSMVDGVLIVDASSRIRRANDALARLLGTTSAKLAGRMLLDVLDPSEQGFAAALVATVENGPFYDREVSFRASDGVRITVTVNGSPHRDGQGALVGVVLVARDERELRKTQAQLQISDRMATMGTLAAGVAHEINNPLAFNISNLEYGVETLQAWKGRVITDAELDELLAALTSALGGAERVRQIVRDLKSFTRVDEDTVATLDLHRLLDTTTTMLRSELKHRAQLRKEYGAPPPIVANEARLVQVFLNLIQNAAQSIPPGNARNHEVCIRTGIDAAGNAVVQISDTGCGIASEHLPRIFDPFFTTKPVGVGTGLGLAICQRIVTGLGGSLSVESTIGEGTTFRVILPAAAAHAEVAASAPVEPRPSIRRVVLVVDDEIEIGEAVRRVLGSEHEVVSVTDGRQALSLLSTRRFDVVLCDVLMPEMTGPELFARLVDEMPDVARRVVFISGGSGRDELFAEITNARLAKPFDARELRETIARVAAEEATTGTRPR